jgi:hypothetical protein
MKQYRMHVLQAKLHELKLNLKIYRSNHALLRSIDYYYDYFDFFISMLIGGLKVPGTGKSSAAQSPVRSRQGSQVNAISVTL